MPMNHIVINRVFQHKVCLRSWTMLFRLLQTAASLGMLIIASTASLVDAETIQTSSFSRTTLSVAPKSHCKRAVCLPDIFKCRPEPNYCKPEPVCIGKSCRPCQKYCRPENVCKYSICRPKPLMCKPEPVCCDPEPCCCDQHRPAKCKILYKLR